MVQTPSFVETIQVVSRRKQQEVLELCHGVPEVAALGSSRGHKHFIIIESADLFWQSAVELLISQLDSTALIVRAPSEPSTDSNISEVVLAGLRARHVP